MRESKQKRTDVSNSLSSHYISVYTHILKREKILTQNVVHLVWVEGKKLFFVPDIVGPLFVLGKKKITPAFTLFFNVQNYKQLLSFFSLFLNAVIVYSVHKHYCLLFSCKSSGFT